MTECPCKQCISYAICKRPHKIVALIYRCCILANYINTMERAYATMKTLLPSYYTETDADTLFHEPSAKAILQAAGIERDKLFKEGVE